MARKQSIVTITDDNRDRGKVFVINEMPAAQAEKWALKALMLAEKAGLDLPAEVRGGGVAGLAVVGFKSLCANVKFEELEPLLDEMWQYIQIKEGASDVSVRKLLDGDIDEVSTRLKLRMELFSLQTGFSLGGGTSNSTSQAPSPSAQQASRNTPMSRARSARLSQPK